jgi:ribonuclease T1
VFRTVLGSAGKPLRRAVHAQGRRWGAVVAVVAGLLAGASLATAAHAREQAPATSATAVSLAELPAQAQETHRLILKGGPFPYPKDGISFGNRERQLPRKSRGYYQEYTVKTPGSRDRGARRIVCGGEQPTLPEVCYYTDDHYASFRRIAP